MQRRTIPQTPTIRAPQSGTTMSGETEPPEKQTTRNVVSNDCLAPPTIIRHTCRIAALMKTPITILRPRGRLSMLPPLVEAAWQAGPSQTLQIARAVANLPCLRASRDRWEQNARREVLRARLPRKMRPNLLRPD